MAEGRDKPFSFFDGEEVAELAEGLSRTLNISYNVYVKEQNTTTNIEGSNIERLGICAESEDHTREASKFPTQAEKDEMLGEEDPAAVSWLTSKLVLFKKRPLSHQKSSKVYYGRQELLKGCYRDVAIKLIQYNKRNKIEVQTLMKLHHPNIVEIVDAGEFVEEVEHWLYIVMELCSINLEEYIKHNPANPEKAFQFFKQIVSAVDFMHKQKIAHRDIKPSNILISKCENLIKFSDFGISKEIPDGLTSVTTTTYGAGTDGYRPPETYNPNYKVSLPSDIFSLGLVTAYLFSHGSHPFGDDPLDWSYKIRKNLKFNLSQIPSAIPHRQQLIDLIKRMLKHVPSDRPTAQEICRLLPSLYVSSPQRLPDNSLPQPAPSADQEISKAIFSPGDSTVFFEGEQNSARATSSSTSNGVQYPISKKDADHPRALTESTTQRQTDNNPTEAVAESPDTSTSEQQESTSVQENPLQVEGADHPQALTESTTQRQTGINRADVVGDPSTSLHEDSAPVLGEAVVTAVQIHVGAGEDNFSSHDSKPFILSSLDVPPEDQKDQVQQPPQLESSTDGNKSVLESFARQ